MADVSGFDVADMEARHQPHQPGTAERGTDDAARCVWDEGDWPCDAFRAVQTIRERDERIRVGAAYMGSAVAELESLRGEGPFTKVCREWLASVSLGEGKPLTWSCGEVVKPGETYKQHVEACLGEPR